MDPFLGQIMPVGFGFPPRGWAFCDGTLLSIAQNSALFSLLGTTFGGDGRTTFALPDLRGRSMVHPGSGAGLSTIRWGQLGGIESKQLSIQEMPVHNHVVPAVAATVSIGGNAESGGSKGNEISSSATNTDGADFNIAGTASVPQNNTTNTGGGQSFNIRNPFLGINVCIAMVGIYPSRN